MTLTQAKQIDAILSLLVNDAEIANFDSNLYREHIYKYFNIPLDEAAFLMKIMFFDIKYNNDNIVKSYGDDAKTISKNYNTQRFINDGGCVKWFNEQLEIERKRQKLEELEKEKLINDIAAFRLTKKQFIITISIAILGLVLSVVGIFIQLF